MRRRRVDYFDDSIYWLFNGEFHRDKDLPARYYFEGGKLDVAYYHQHDKRHRTTGPAYFDYNEKIKKYFYQGRRYASLEEMLMVEACR